MIRSRSALVFLVLGAALVLASPATAGAGSEEPAALAVHVASPCAPSSSFLAENADPDQEQPPALSELLDDLVPAPRPMGFQAWPGCWQCWYGAPCCGCDQETAIISCDDYCGCW